MDRQQGLDDFRREVNLNLGCGALADYVLPVTSDDGGCPVVVALEDERLSVVFGRIRAVGGFANLFVRGKDGAVRAASVLNDVCAIADPDDAMTGEDAPAPTATIGMFLDYLARRPGGVTISMVIGYPACARDVGTMEFAHPPVGWP